MTMDIAVNGTIASVLPDDVHRVNGTTEAFLSDDAYLVISIYLVVIGIYSY